MKNTLVQYKGGGYDGCFWEWNWFFFDKNGEFHNIFSSGYAGVTSKEQAAELLSYGGDRHVYRYDLTKTEDIDELSRECNPVNLVSILEWFCDNRQPDGSPYIDFYVRCSDCGERIWDTSEISLEEWHGCGGIMLTADKVLCQGCWSNGTCDCCGEYVGEENIIGLYQIEIDSDCIRGESDYKAARDMIDEHYDCVCIWCLESRRERIEEQEQEDIRWQAFATGVPDIFSDSIRWYWDV